MKVQLGNATFDVTFVQNRDNEFLGDGYTIISIKDRDYVLDRSKLNLFHIADPDDPNATLIADDFIKFAGTASSLRKRKYKIVYTGECYWFFHDLIHAEYDVTDDSAGLYIDGECEARAATLGAVLALRHNIPASDVFRELAKIGPEFKNRFGYEFDPIARLLESGKVRLELA